MCRRVCLTGFLACTSILLGSPLIAAQPGRLSAPPPIRKDAVLDALKPLPSGQGLVVFEPVAKGANADVAAFGAAAARWLHFNVAGRVAFGKTPVYTAPDRVRKELQRADLRLAGAIARRAAVKLGVTLYATGAISGNTDKAKLVFQLYSVAGAKPQGAPMVSTGSLEQIAVGLPEIGQLLAKRAGVPRGTAVDPPVAPDLVAFGAYPWNCSATLTKTQLAGIEELGQRLPVAAIASLDAVSSQDPDALGKSLDALMTLAPHSLMALERITFMNRDYFGTNVERVTSVLHQSPNNYLAHFADTHLNAAVGEAEVVFALKGVRLAPRNPEAWYCLSAAYGDHAQAIRKSKIAALITDEEGAALEKIYPRAVAAALRAVNLDPDWHSSWQELAVAATFNGDDHIATPAIWNSIRLSPDSTSPYIWATEMFQTKWGGDPASLAKVAQLAADRHFTNPVGTLQLAYNCRSLGFQKPFQALSARARDLYLARIELRPASASLRFQLGNALEGLGDRGGAAEQYRAAIAVDPKNGRAHYLLGKLLSRPTWTAEAFQEAQTAMELMPSSADAHILMGYGLMYWKKDTAACEKELRRAVEVDATSSNAQLSLGFVLVLEWKHAEAIPHLRESLKSYPNNLDAMRYLTRALLGDKQYEAAAQTMESAVMLSPLHADMHSLLGNAYIGLGRKDEALAAYQRAAELDPADTSDRMNAAKILLEKGDIRKARELWTKVVEIAPSSPDGEWARKRLAENPAP